MPRDQSGSLEVDLCSFIVIGLLLSNPQLQISSRICYKASFNFIYATTDCLTLALQNKATHSLTPVGIPCDDE